jgi:acetamidase/formamidase
MAEYHVAATPETVQWGRFSAAFAPVLTVESGDTVTLESVSGAPEVLPPDDGPFQVPPSLRRIHAEVARYQGHIITGPIAVRGAAPGDLLEVRIEAVELAADWGYCGFRPEFGTLPDDFPYRHLTHIPIDRAAMTCRLPHGLILPLAPFFGVMGTAPSTNQGFLSTIEPGPFGGNLDNKELGAGSVLFLPVWADGALFSAGDGHGVQGDGEVCINALETCLNGRFRLILHKQAGVSYPRAETPSHYICMGMHCDLNEAHRIALRQMIAFLVERVGITPADAYQLCSLAVDFRITQSVNGEKGVHGMLAKRLVP